jgi:predicted DNA-binding transcriptional regulator AlpA
MRPRQPTWACGDLEPLLIDAKTFGKLLCIGRSKSYELLASGRVPGVVRIGRSLRVSLRSARDWVEQQVALSAGDIAQPLGPASGDERLRRDVHRDASKQGRGQRDGD